MFPRGGYADLNIERMAINHPFEYQYFTPCQSEWSIYNTLNDLTCLLTGTANRHMIARPRKKR